MTQTRRDEYLEALGITAYVPRGTDTPSKPWHIQGQLPKANVVFIFAAPNNEAALDWSHPDLTLLKKIIEASAIPQDAYVLLWPTDTPGSLPSISAHATAITFGQPCSHAKTITTVSLSQLHNQMEAKRTLWNALKALRTQYA